MRGQPWTARTPTRAAADALRRFHAFELDAGNDELDRLLGLDTHAGERSTARDEGRDQRHNRLYRGDMPYTVIRALYRRLAPAERAHILDLGSGYGRIALYGGALLGVRFTGIEIVPARVREADRASRALGLRRVVFRAGDALTAPWPRASCICLMNSFMPRQTPQALKRLRLEAETGTVVAAVSTVATPLANQSWLEELLGADRGRLLRLFRTR